MKNPTAATGFRFWLWLIRFVGLIVPGRLRANWRQEWEAELRHRETMLADWDKLNWQTKLDLLRRSVGAFWDALWLQPHRWEDEMMQDLRLGLRLLLKKPGFAAVAILTLALGVGANTAIFSVVRTVLLQPLPYAESERLLQIRYTFPQLSLEQAWVPHRDMLDWQTQHQGLESLGVYQYAMFNFAEDGAPEAVYGLQVTSDVLPMLGVQPALGRFFSPSEDQPEQNRVIILSDELWRRRFGARPEIVGQTIRANKQNYTVIGVMPPGFNFPLKLATELRLPSRQMGFWAPIGADVSKLSRENAQSGAVAKLKPGVSVAQAQAEANAIMERLARDYPQSNVGRQARLVPLKEQTVGAARAALLLLLGSVGLVVLLTCANIASLLLVRADARQREMAIRQALGASRARLVRQALTESLLLAVGGGVAGLLLAHWSLPLLLELSPPAVPRLSEARIDFWVFGFAFVVTSFAGLLFGLAPAWRAARVSLNEGLKHGGKQSGTRSSATGSVLIVTEMAIALVLTVGASLLLNSFVRLLQIDPGFNPERLLASVIILPNQQYPTSETKVEFFRRLVERVEALPGVESAAVTNGLPLSGNDFSEQVRIEGRPPISAIEPRLEADTPAVSSHYLRTIGVTLLRGRLIDEKDTAQSSPVVVINDLAAKQYWPGEDPLGKRLSLGLSDENRVWREVVGVVRGTRHRGLDWPVRPEVFLPLEQAPTMPYFLVARSALPKQSLATSIRQAVAAIDSDQPIFLINSMEELMADSIAERRFSLLLLGIFSLMALTLAAVGIYGVLSYAVTERTYEIGVRMALGAAPQSVLRLMIGRGMRPALLGLGIGLAAALGLTRMMKSLLFGLSATDPVTFISVTLLLLGVGLVACYLPARRAAKIDPLVALRHE